MIHGNSKVSGGNADARSSHGSIKVSSAGGSLLVQWLSLHASNAGDTGLIPGWGAKIPHSVVERGKVLVTRSCLTLTPRTTGARQDPSFLGFPRQEYWSGLPGPSPGDLPDPGTEVPGTVSRIAGRLYCLNHQGVFSWFVENKI